MDYRRMVAKLREDDRALLKVAYKDTIEMIPLKTLNGIKPPMSRVIKRIITHWRWAVYDDGWYVDRRQSYWVCTYHETMTRVKKAYNKRCLRIKKRNNAQRMTHIIQKKLMHEELMFHPRFMTNALDTIEMESMFANFGY